MRKNDNKSTVQLFLISFSVLLLLLLLVSPSLQSHFLLLFLHSHSDTGDWLPSFFSSSVLFSLFHVQFLYFIVVVFHCFCYVRKENSFILLHSFSLFFWIYYLVFFLFLILPFIKNVYICTYIVWRHEKLKPEIFIMIFLHHFIFLVFLLSLKQQGSKSSFFWRYTQWWQEK